MVALIKIILGVLRKSNLCTWNLEVAKDMEVGWGRQ